MSTINTNPNKNKGPRIGAHVSIAEGLHRAPERGRAVRCEVIQVFTRNQIQWNIPPLTDSIIKRFKESMQASGLIGCVAHASYLINLATDRKDLYDKSVKTLADELERCERLNLFGLIFHPGSAHHNDRVMGIRRVSRAIREVLNSVEPRTKLPCMLLVENAAGQGNTLPVTIEEWYDIVASVDEPRRVGWCLDTCHAFAAGFPIHTPKGYKEFMKQLESRSMLERISIVHANDSAKPYGSRVDRHQNIGEGFIGNGLFRRLIRDPRWSRSWVIIETPKDSAGQQDLENLKKLFSFRDAP